MNEITDFHSFRHGDFDITVLSDGPITLPGEIFAPEAAADERAAVVERLGGADNAAHAQSNIPLIVSGKDIILIASVPARASSRARASLRPICAGSASIPTT